VAVSVHFSSVAFHSFAVVGQNGMVSIHLLMVAVHFSFVVVRFCLVALHFILVVGQNGIVAVHFRLVANHF
jgi:hypothetical protein